jgi:hypothetical protein
MATQGIVSLIVGGKVQVKAVAGCNGFKCRQLCLAIEADNLSTPEEIYDAAKEVSFGCPDCLVVMDAEREIFEGEDELGGLYRKTFDDPVFNPRWAHGMAAYAEYVER